MLKRRREELRAERERALDAISYLQAQLRAERERAAAIADLLEQLGVEPEEEEG